MPMATSTMSATVTAGTRATAQLEVWSARVVLAMMWMVLMTVTAETVIWWQRDRMGAGRQWGFGLRRCRGLGPQRRRGGPGSTAARRAVDADGQTEARTVQAVGMEATSVAGMRLWCHLIMSGADSGGASS